MLHLIALSDFLAKATHVNSFVRRNHKRQDSTHTTGVATMNLASVTALATKPSVPMPPLMNASASVAIRGFQALIWTAPQQRIRTFGNSALFGRVREWNRKDPGVRTLERNFF